jgi:hypothetical protein
MGEKSLKSKEIPCANCQSWAKKEKKFSCNPDECKGLTAWLYENAPNMTKDKANLQFTVKFPVSACQYIV